MHLNEAIWVNETPAHPDVGFTPGCRYCKRQDSGPWGDIWRRVFSGTKLSSKIKQPGKPENNRKQKDSSDVHAKN